ncbi:hypothetical protein LAZ67_9000862 [Cordylochernes scorpioides]|uniref:Uncharacterized protein n=1 Tax=Cordylochernes scorpioides TaxID=51811 RepID=A0ABY6KXR0_9ARAC|nr:hypothetical protein LAZ67_9000862 [Cordylochernes scorpioides]
MKKKKCVRAPYFPEKGMAEMGVPNYYQILAESQEDVEDDCNTPNQDITANAEISAEELSYIFTVNKRKNGDSPSPLNQGQPHATGASFTVGAVVAFGSPVNGQNHWAEIIETDEAGENSFIQPKRKRNRNCGSRLPRAIATTNRTEIHSSNKVLRNSGCQTSSTRRDQYHKIKATSQASC